MEKNVLNGLLSKFVGSRGEKLQPMGGCGHGRKPRWARVVGYALHVNPDPQTIPCHRVVNRLGEVSDAFAFGGGNRQRELLEQEGIVFDENGRIDLEKYLMDI